MIFRKFLATVWILALGWSALYAQNNLNQDVDKLEKFLKSLDKDYVDAVETRGIVEAGIRGMLEELDPHSVYLDPDAYARANEPLRGKYKGIGVRFIMIDDTMTILDVVPGGSAELAGIRAGDQIIRIEGDTISGVGRSSRSVSQDIKNIEGNVINGLTLRKFPERKYITVQMKKSDIEISSVPASFMLENRTGYIKLDRFSSTSLDEFREGLDELTEQRLRNLIIDLRGNGGGYLNVAIKIVDEFLEDRRLIVYTEGEHQDKREIFATSGGRFTNGELYVLIDANSASASEIFAGAIQDWDRGLIIGRRSYGKGLVQRTVEFADGSAIRLTISRYYTPTGRSIQRSYAAGADAYREELNSRLDNGELFSADSIHLIDTLVYFTPNKRKVYGGGGIIPDVFIPMDTTLTDELLTSIRRKALFQGYALEVAGNNTEELLRSYEGPSDFLSNYSLADSDFQDIKRYLQLKGIEYEQENLLAIRDDVEQLVKIPLARFLYGYESYFQARAYYDNDVHAALREIDEGTFRELGLK